MRSRSGSPAAGPRWLLAAALLGLQGACAAPPTAEGTAQDSVVSGDGTLRARVLDRDGEPYRVAFTLAPWDAVEPRSSGFGLVLVDDSEALSGESDTAGRFSASIAPGIWAVVSDDLLDQATERREHCFLMGDAYVPWQGEDDETWRVECDSLRLKLLLAACGAWASACSAPESAQDSSPPPLDLAAASGWYPFAMDDAPEVAAFVTFSLDGTTIITSLDGGGEGPLDGWSFALSTTAVSHSYGSNETTWQLTTIYDGTFISTDRIEGTTGYDATCEGAYCAPEDTYTASGAFSADKTTRP